MPIWCQTGPGPAGRGGAGEVERPAELRAGRGSKATTALTTFGSVAVVLVRRSGWRASPCRCRARPAAPARGAGPRVERRQIALQVDHALESAARDRAPAAPRRSGRCRRAAPDRSAPPRRRRPAPPRRSPARRRRPRPARRSAPVARRQTCTIIGSPAIGASGLSGSRVEPSRAGIRTMVRDDMSSPSGAGRDAIFTLARQPGAARLAALTPACAGGLPTRRASARRARRRVGWQPTRIRSRWQGLSKATSSSRPC